MLRIAFFEDDQAEQFFPIARMRPVFELLCGHFSVRERILSSIPGTSWGVWIRSQLVEVYQEEHPTAKVNDICWMQQEPTLLVNGRWVTFEQPLSQATAGTAGWIGDELAWVVVDPQDDCSDHGELDWKKILHLARKKRALIAEGQLLHYPWDLITNNARQLTHDFMHRAKGKSRPIDPNVALLGSEENLFVHATAAIDPFVVLDAQHGPIWIDANARIQAFTRIEGPAFIGRETQTFRANIREGTSIGPVCRVGGEIEESILHGYVNKYHDGFLGHSYVCPWVNLGALTTNSDLKNDYSNVSVPLMGAGIQTHSNKIGCFIGDHTKTALCSLFNTGSSIGVMSLILPGGELLPKHIPSFTRFWHGKLEELPDQTISALQTAQYAMQRRQQTLTPAMTRLIQTLFIQTQAERDRAQQRTTA